MPKKAAKKKKAKKSAPKKSSKKTLKKKPLKKKTSKKATRKKTTAKKKLAKKKTALKKAKKVRPKVKPGGATKTVKPVKETAQQETAIGAVTHYYSHLNVAVVQLNTGELKTGDMIHIKGMTTDFIQQVESMQFEHQPINQAMAGQCFGLQVKEHAREHDIVYLMK